MSLIRRLSASITSSVDRAVSKVENHDAIINAALRDTQQAAARSRVRLERVRKGCCRLDRGHQNSRRQQGRHSHATNDACKFLHVDSVPSVKSLTIPPPP